MIPQLVGHIKTYLGSSVPVIAPDTIATKPNSEVGTLSLGAKLWYWRFQDHSPALGTVHLRSIRQSHCWSEKTAGDIVNHSMALITTFIGNDFLYVWTNNPLETVTQPASISIFTQALKYRETRYQAVELLTALLGTCTFVSFCVHSQATIQQTIRLFLKRLRTTMVSNLWLRY